MSEKSLENAKRVYATVIKTLDSRNWTYEREDDKMRVHFDVHGDDLPMSLTLSVVPDVDLIICVSRLPFDVPEDKAELACFVVNELNVNMISGSFEYDHDDDTIAYRTCSYINDTIVGCGMIEDIIDNVCCKVDEYNDKFLFLLKDKITVDEFFEDDDDEDNDD